MNIDVTKTVGELTSDLPNAFRIFEKAGIDYCCGGKRSLADACSRAGVAIEPLVRALEADAETAPAPAIDWRARPLAELVRHIVGVHHVFTREELVRAGALLAKVCTVHGEKHPELHRVRASFERLRDELRLHMMKEENVLFPYTLALEEAQSRGARAAAPPFRTVKNPVRMMDHEHESAGEELRAMRAASAGYAIPEGACGSYRALYASLEALESDLHMHIHLESNVLFPRAIELEQG